MFREKDETIMVFIFGYDSKHKIALKPRLTAAQFSNSYLFEFGWFELVRGHIMAKDIMTSVPIGQPKFWGPCQAL